MATEKTLNTRIALKIDTYENWTLDNENTRDKKIGANYVLKRGEIGLCQIGDTAASGKAEATTNPTVLFKVGDGSTPFKTLKWASALAADVYDWAKKPEADFKEWAGTNIDTDNDTRYTFEIDGGKLVVKSKLYSKGSPTGEAKEVASLDFVTPAELETLLAGYVKSVNTDSTGTITVNKTAAQTDAQNPVINFNIADGSNAGNVTLTDTANGLKAEVNLSAYRLIADDENTAHTHSTKEKSGIKANGAGDISGDTTFELNVAFDTYIKETDKKTYIRLYDKSDTSKKSLAELDATAFIKDGMISSVELVNKDGNNTAGQFLKITWNTDAGKDIVYLNVTELVDVYTGEAGITVVDGTDGKIIKHTNAITAKTGYTTSNSTLTFGGTFGVVEEKYDAQGHITGAKTTTYTLPALPTPEDIGAATPANIGNGKFTVSGATNGAIELVEKSTGIMTANQATGTDTKAILDVKTSGITTVKLADKAVTTAKIADQAVGAEQTKAYKKADGTSEEVWVFDCGGAGIE